MLDILKKRDWDPLIESMEKLKNYRVNYSLWETLLNSLFSTIPLHFLFFFKLLKWVANKIDRIRRNFL